MQSAEHDELCITANLKMCEYVTLVANTHGNY